MASKARARSKKGPKLLSNSRPPLTSTSLLGSSSSRNTRSIIRFHHTVQKELAKAKAAKDTAKTQELEAQLAANGALRKYQAASTLGQANDRGGDTSRILVEWLQPVLQAVPSNCQDGTACLRILEVGALSTKNALNIPGKTVVRRIDLHSQESGIEQRDFMTLPYDGLWRGSSHYDIVSLSLVVNYVGDPKQRGLMLERTTQFLSPSSNRDNAADTKLPALFLVLPLPCVDNSRYLNEDRLSAIMTTLGYEKIMVKRSQKLFYSLWRLDAARVGVERPVIPALSRKRELRSGKDRNNFHISL